MIDFNEALEDEVLEDDEFFFEDDDDDDMDYLDDVEDDDDDALDEYSEDDDDDDFGERRRRRPRRRNRRRRFSPRTRIRRPKVARGRGFFKRPPSKKVASVGSLRSSLARVGKDIRANAVAIKKLASQVSRATIANDKANRRQDSRIAENRSDMRKHIKAAKQQNQMTMLLPLLQDSPSLEAKQGGDLDHATATLADVQVKKPDNTMALLLMMMSQGAGGDMNSMLPLFLLMTK